MRHALLLNAGAISLALTLGLSFMLIATLSSNTVINSADASALAGTPLVVPLPRITSREMNRLPPGERRPANFATEQPASAFADGIRRTLSGVLPSDGQTGGTCVAVTGTDVGSGASTIAIALARLAAARGVRVLLIDTDFEEAGATRAMGIEPAAGIEAILSGDCQLADLVVEDDLTSVHLLPCLPGRAGRAALSLSQLTALKAAIAVARTGYDLVVIDCKPFATRSAVRSLSRMADSALLVSAYGNTRRDRLGVLARRTRQNGATICGVVFNLVPSNNRRKLFAFDSRSSGNPLPEPPSPTFNGGLEAAQEVRIIH
jgi:Mrp family chromosome partitioning ATPase